MYVYKNVHEYRTDFGTTVKSDQQVHTKIIYYNKYSNIHENKDYEKRIETYSHACIGIKDKEKTIYRRIHGIS